MGKAEIPSEPPRVAEVLRRHFLGLEGVTQETLGKALGVSRHSVNELMNGRRAVTAVMALRLARVLGTDPEFWMNLQQNWELHQARRDHGAAIEKLKALRAERGFEEVARPLDEVFRGDSPEAKPPRRTATG